MKKSKLSLEKFRIAKLNNLSSILGGNNDGDNTQTDDKPNNKCIAKSAIIIKM